MTYVSTLQPALYAYIVYMVHVVHVGYIEARFLPIFIRPHIQGT